MASPRLLRDLRMALACLYTLSPEATANMDSRQAHDFLFYIQTRNVRRKLRSMQQSDRDQQKNKSTSSPRKDHLADEREGSTWLACLALLCCEDAHSAERLFAAQTLVHRLRRSKLSEAIDVEMEDPTTMMVLPALSVNLSQVVSQYGNWMNNFHPLLGSLVQQFVSSNMPEDEDQLKGELTMLTLSAITYLTACSSLADPNIHPLVFCLGSSLAATALRLRFTPQSVMTSPPATATSAPLVTMVVRSLSTAASTQQQPETLYHCMCSCISAIPDTLLSSPGGALDRFSIDPRCVQAAHEELRQFSTGIHLVWEALGHMPSSSHTELLHKSFLSTCQSWAKCFALSHDFIDHTVPLAGQYLCHIESPTNKVAMSYLIAIFESGSWKHEEILQFSLGLSNDSHNQANKKRQTSRSKKRQQAVIDSTATDDLRARAHEECKFRGEVACRTTSLIWDQLAPACRQALTETRNCTGGEGPVGCLCACANTCLPHWIRQQETPINLVRSVMEVFQEVCSLQSRALAYEPLYTLHSAFMSSASEQQVPLTEMQLLVADHLFQSTMRLATSCGYPPHYFDDLARDSDDDMEIQRNDVRDLIRAVSGSEDGSLSSSQDGTRRQDISIRIFEQMARSCAQACIVYPSLPPETAVHALSALAKPLSQLAVLYRTNHREDMADILLVAMEALGAVHRSLVVAFSNPTSHVDLFPVSRLANLATAAFAPAFDTVCMFGHDNPRLSSALRESVDAAVHSAALSIVHIPELAAESTLDHTMYDIRGAMRGPGGEDHVGCLALLRLAYESDELARIMTAMDSSLPLELCKLHDSLKSIENERGPEVMHGKGVCPKARRMLLETICRMVLLRTGESSADGPIETNQEALKVLNDLFSSLVSSVTMLTSELSSIDEGRMYYICQGVYDLSAFSPSMVSTVFSDVGESEMLSMRRQFLCNVVEVGKLGYLRRPLISPPDGLILQWGRLRGGLFALLRASACPDIPRSATDAIILLSKTECQAIADQCSAGPSAHSSIFSDSVISEEFFPSGAFIRVVGEVVEAQRENGYASIRNCIFALHELRIPVLDTLLLECPEPSNSAFVDPRPALAEAWLNSLIASFNVEGTSPTFPCNDALTRRLLVDSCCTVLLLLLFPTLTKDQTQPDSGMSLDGPHTRALLAFLESYFLLGPDMLRAVALLLRSKVDIDVENNILSGQDAASQGVAIVGACLFRASSGGLPSWAIEVMPSLYAALYYACGSDVVVFCQMLRLSMEVRSLTPFGGVARGKLLAGPFIEKAKESSLQTFVQKSHEACSKNNSDGWRRFKVLLKQACGGKKKASLSLKPSYTEWDSDRL